jgi:hypothetical protein
LGLWILDTIPPFFAVENKPRPSHFFLLFNSLFSFIRDP